MWGFMALFGQGGNALRKLTGLLTVMLLALTCATAQAFPRLFTFAKPPKPPITLSLAWVTAPCHPDGRVVITVTNISDREVAMPIQGPLAADGLSEHMLRDEACLETGACHCGQRQASAATRVIPIACATPAPLHHCRDEGYASLVSVPVMLHGTVLGEVDLFFRREVQLSPAERSLLDSLASHLASARESLRAEALGREAAVAQERGMLARELHDSIAQSLAFLKIQVQLLREAVRRADSEAVECAPMCSTRAAGS